MSTGQVGAPRDARDLDTPYWLLVEDDARVSMALSRLLGQYAPVRHATTVEEALSLLSSAHRCCGAVLDVHLPDGSGLDVLEDMRRRQMKTPALVVTAYCDHEKVSRAQLLGAQFLWKPWDPKNLKAFADQILLQPGFYMDFEQRLQRYCLAQRLSPRESEVVRQATSGCALSDIPERMGVSRNTVKTLIRRILSKTEATSVAEITRILHTQMIGPPAWKNDMS